MKSTLLVLAVLLSGMALHAQKFYEGSETIDGFEFKWSVWEAAGYYDKYTLNFQVLKDVKYAYIDVDVTVSEGSITKTEHYAINLISGKSEYYNMKTTIPIVDRNKKLKSVKFSNLVVAKQEAGGNKVNPN